MFVTGAELSLMNKGFLPGDTEGDRLVLLLNQQDRDRLRERVGEVSARVNDFLGNAEAVVRERFGGRIAYAAIPLERVDWAPFKSFDEPSDLCRRRSRARARPCRIRS